MPIKGTGNGLSVAPKASARDVFLLDAALGHFFAQSVESHVQ